MEDYSPYDLTDDDDTEELPPREIYIPAPKEALDAAGFKLFQRMLYIISIVSFLH